MKKEGQNSNFKTWRNIFKITLVLFLLTVIFTFVQPLKYRSSTRFLVVQNYAGVVDPYAASKSNQYLSDILAQVIGSSSFQNEVMNSGFNIDGSVFSQNDQKRKDQWDKTVSAKAVSDTGMIAVNVFHKNRTQADQIAQAISYVLKTKHTLYHGGGDKVSIMVIDKPITTNWPVKPNVVVNLTLALIFGLVFGAAFVYFFPESEFKFGYLTKVFKRKRHKDLDFGYINSSFTKKEELYDKLEE